MWSHLISSQDFLYASATHRIGFCCKSHPQMFCLFTSEESIENLFGNNRPLFIKCFGNDSKSLRLNGKRPLDGASLPPLTISLLPSHWLLWILCIQFLFCCTSWFRELSCCFSTQNLEVLLDFHRIASVSRTFIKTETPKSMYLRFFTQLCYPKVCLLLIAVWRTVMEFGREFRCGCSGVSPYSLMTNYVVLSAVDNLGFPIWLPRLTMMGVCCIS